MENQCTARGQIYVCKLEKDDEVFGAKFGTSKHPAVRLKQIKTRSFAFADCIADPWALEAEDGLAEEIENALKKHFQRFLVRTRWNTREIVFPWLTEALRWTIESCLENPDKIDEIAWRGANKPFSMLSRAEINFGEDTIGHGRFGNNFLTSDDLNKHLGSMGLPRVIESPRLDSACATDIKLRIDMNTIRVEYLIEFGLDPRLEGADHSSAWIPQIDGPLRYMLFRPHEHFEMGRIKYSPYRAIGGHLSGVKFIEIYEKDIFSKPKVSVTGIRGETIGEEEQSFFKAARVTAPNRR